MNTIRIIAAVLDTEKLVLYKENGNTVVINQGDSRIRTIIDQAEEQIIRQGYADISLEYVDPVANIYQEFEQLLRGAIKLYRVNKHKFQAILASALSEEEPETAPTVEPTILGIVPTGSEPDSVHVSAPTKEEVTDVTSNRQPSRKEAIDEIMNNAQSVSDPAYHATETSSDDTHIAVLEDEQGEPLVVPGMEHLQAQMNHAVKLGSVVGAENFIRRIAAVIDKRGHTIEELLNFMSRGDLPIADDGSIVSYKVLKTIPGIEKGYYVDCHSGKVLQRIGSYVTQANVDESRRTECSTGLHIARRGYLKSFNGNIIVMVKVNPEDVMAVPSGEPDKMRARGYQILFEIPSEDHSVLRNNRPIENTQSKKLLTMALRGEHIGIIETVSIGGPKGTDVVVTPTEEVETNQKAPKPKKNTPTTEAVDVDFKESHKNALAVDPKKTSQKVAEAKTVTEQRQLFNEKKFDELKALKKTKKKSYDALGFTPEETEIILSDPAPQTAPKDVPNLPDVDVSTMSRKEKVQHYLAIISNHRDSVTRQQAYRDLIELKRTSKIGWSALGVDNFDQLQKQMESK